MRLFERMASKASSGAVEKQKKDLLSSVFLYLKKNEFSTIPCILQKIMDLMQNPAVGAAEYAKVCEMDQSSCMRILRMANSVYFGARDGRIIRTIKDAVVRLGFEKAREVIQSSVVSSLFRTKQSVGNYSAQALWVNSVAVASGVRLIYGLCPSLKKPDVDPYLAGLLRNIGIPLLHLCFFDEGFSDAVSACQANKTLLHDEELAHIGIGHQAVGMEVAGKWMLHPDITSVIGHHHDIGVENEDLKMLIHVTRVAEWMAFESGLGYSDFSDAQVDSYAQSLGMLQIDEAGYERVKKDMATELEQAKNLGWFAGIVSH